MAHSGSRSQAPLAGRWPHKLVQCVDRTGLGTTGWEQAGNKESSAIALTVKGQLPVKLNPAVTHSHHPACQATTSANRRQGQVRLAKGQCRRVDAAPQAATPLLGKPCCVSGRELHWCCCWATQQCNTCRAKYWNSSWTGVALSTLQVSKRWARPAQQQ